MSTSCIVWASIAIVEFIALAYCWLGNTDRRDEDSKA